MVATQVFQDRRHAGRVLARALSRHAGEAGLCVLALPRGGVPVAFEVAQALRAPLDVWVVRKLGVPGHEEYAMGALAPGGVRVLDAALVESLGIAPADVDEVLRAEQAELQRREALYRASRPPPELRGRSVLLVDDGLATGACMRAAVRSVRVQRPACITVAVPTGAPDSCASLRREADELVCVNRPEPFFAVGRWYVDFSQTEDEEVLALLAQSMPLGGAS